MTGDPPLPRAPWDAALSSRLGWLCPVFPQQPELAAMASSHSPVNSQVPVSLPPDRGSLRWAVCLTQPCVPSTGLAHRPWCLVGCPPLAPPGSRFGRSFGENGIRPAPGAGDTGQGCGLQGQGPLWRWGVWTLLLPGSITQLRQLPRGAVVPLAYPALCPASQAPVTSAKLQ